MGATEDDYHVGILCGISRAAEPNNVQLVCVAGGVVGEPSKDQRSQRNFLFDLLEPHRFDGIIALSGALGNQVGVAEFGKFLGRFRGRPIVSLGIEMTRTASRSTRDWSCRGGGHASPAHTPSVSCSTNAACASKP